MATRFFALLRRPALTALAMIALCEGGIGARAETGASFDVAATVSSGCQVDGLGSSGDAGNIGTLDFGMDTSFSTATHHTSIGASQTIRLRCTPGVTLLLSVDGGTHAQGGARHLQKDGDPSARLAYALCRDAACAQPITIGGNTSISVTSANSDNVRLPLHASLTLPGNVPGGVYSDELLVTLSW